MSPDTIVFIACCTFGGCMAGVEVARQLVTRKERLRRERAEAAKEELAAIATAALRQDVLTARAKARKAYQDARKRRDTRDQRRAADEARTATTRVLQLELGR